MDWITNANGLVALLTGLFGLIGTGVGAFFSIRAFIQKNKANTRQQNWNMIMQAADAAMEVVEHAQLHNSSEKKALAMDMIKKSCESLGLDISAFLTQLDAYIDQCIEWFNGMKKDQ